MMEIFMFANLFLGIAMIIYVSILIKKLGGLPRLVKPWQAMLVGVAVFIISQIVTVLESFTLINPLFPVEFLDTVFFGFLVLSLFYFKLSWEVPK